MQADASPLDFYDLKGIVEELLDGLARQRDDAWPRPLIRCCIPGARRCCNSGGRHSACLANCIRSSAKRWELPAHPVLVGEFDLEAILAHMDSRFIVKPISRYPAVVQDIALIVDEPVEAGRVEQLIRQTGGALLHEVRLFDVYRGAPLPAGQKVAGVYARAFKRSTTGCPTPRQANCAKKSSDDCGAKCKRNCAAANGIPEDAGLMPLLSCSNRRCADAILAAEVRTTMGFNWFDFILILALLVGMAIGFAQGAVRQAIGLAALYVGLVLATQFFQPVSRIFGQPVEHAAKYAEQCDCLFRHSDSRSAALINFLAIDAYKQTKIRLVPLLDHIVGMGLGLLSMWIHCSRLW